MFNKETRLFAFLMQEPALRALLAEQWRKHPLSIEKYLHQPTLSIEAYNTSKRIYIRDPYTSQVITYIEYTASLFKFWKPAWTLMLDPEDEEWQYFWESFVKTMIQELETTQIQNNVYHNDFLNQMLNTPHNEWVEQLQLMHQLSLELKDFGLPTQNVTTEEIDIIL